GAAALNGVLGGDTVTLGGAASAVFADKDVGTAKAVTGSGYSLTGADAGNYSPTQPPGFTPSITPAQPTLIGPGAAGRGYTTTTNVALSGGALAGLKGSDSLTLTAGTGAFADKNAGLNKQVIVSGYGISGAAAGNYTLTQPTNVFADIT